MLSPKPDQNIALYLTMFTLSLSCPEKNSFPFGAFPEWIPLVFTIQCSIVSTQYAVLSIQYWVFSVRYWVLTKVFEGPWKSKPGQGHQMGTRLNRVQKHHWSPSSIRYFEKNTSGAITEVLGHGGEATHSQNSCIKRSQGLLLSLTGSAYFTVTWDRICICISLSW